MSPLPTGRGRDFKPRIRRRLASTARIVLASLELYDLALDAVGCGLVSVRRPDDEAGDEVDDAEDVDGTLNN